MNKDLLKIKEMFNVGLITQEQFIITIKQTGNPACQRFVQLLDKELN